MNKGEFVSFVSAKYDCSKVDAEKAIDIFTNSVIDALGQGKEITLVGFGSFVVKNVPERSGRNPRTGAPLAIEAYNQPKFKVGQKLKDACNPSK